MRLATAAFLYWLVVFAVGFVLGTIRVLGLVPMLGEEIAVLIEGPFILAACGITSWWIVRRFAIASYADSLVVGLLAFVLLMIAELTLAVTGFDMTPAEWFAALWVPPGSWGLLGQVLFALLPFIMVVLMRRTPTKGL